MNLAASAIYYVEGDKSSHKFSEPPRLKTVNYPGSPQPWGRGAQVSDDGMGSEVAEDALLWPDLTRPDPSFFLIA